MQRSPSIALLIAAALAPACGAPQDTSHLQVGYLIDDRVLHAEADAVALAVDSEAELAVFEPRYLRGQTRALSVDEVRPINVRSADVTDDGVASVVGVDGSRVRLKAHQPGTTDLSVKTFRGETRYRLHVAEPSSVTISHPRFREGQPAPLFLEGGTGRFNMERRDARGRLLGGSGALPPVFVDPPEAATIAIRDGDADRIDVRFHQAGELVLRPMGSPPLSLTVVKAGDVFGMGMAAFEPDSDEPLPFAAMAPGERQNATLRLWTEDGRPVLGSLGRIEVVSKTPEICSLRGLDALEADGVYEVEGRQAGECQLGLTLGEMQADETIQIRDPESGDEALRGVLADEPAAASD